LKSRVLLPSKALSIPLLISFSNNHHSHHATVLSTCVAVEQYRLNPFQRNSWRLPETPRSLKYFSTNSSACAALMLPTFSHTRIVPISSCRDGAYPLYRIPSLPHTLSTAYPLYTISYKTPTLCDDINKFSIETIITCSNRHIDSVCSTVPGHQREVFGFLYSWTWTSHSRDWRD